jgi:hypothetical protein
MNSQENVRDYLNSENNFNNLYKIIEKNIKQNKNYQEDYDFKDRLKLKVDSVLGSNKSNNLMELNQQVITEIIPELVNDINGIRESVLASEIDQYINQELIPNINVNMDPMYMDPELRKMYLDSTKMLPNDRNTFITQPDTDQPKDLYKEDSVIKQMLLDKQNEELNSNQELLEITSEIYNKTDKYSNQFHEYNVTINTADRNTTLNLDSETKITVNYNYQNPASGETATELNVKGERFKNIITMEIINISIPTVFFSNGAGAIATYGVKKYNPVIIVKTDSTFNVHPFLYLDIDEITPNMNLSNGKRVMCKLHSPSRNGILTNFKVAGGKKIFRRTELLTLSKMNINILDSNGEKCVLAYGACNFGTSNPTALGDNADLEKNITIDFKITEVEPEITFTVNG